MSRRNRGKNCPRCGSKDVQLQEDLQENTVLYVCMDCDYQLPTGAPSPRKEPRRRDMTKRSPAREGVDPDK